MSYKSAVLKQIRNEKKQAINEEKIKKNTEELTKKLEKMSPEKRQKFVSELTTKLRIVKAELKDLRLDEEKRERLLFELETNRYHMSDKLKYGILYAGTLISYFASAGISAAIFPEELARVCVGIAAGSAIVGLGISALGTHIYQNKIISKISSKLKLRNTRLKLAKITKTQDDIELKLKKAQELEK